ncbi:MAG: transglutaminase domain-containing protein [Fimbriimonadaceae bacterium]|nr:transglutaminase domain-containing protein [Fimbriimonadaceae bacterium]QYK54743.1 MAG: transglutaminase domain-containing protein [Fimbriimonadaceae bacterium]
MTERTLRRGLLDHLLVLFGCGMAVYAVGMSLSKPVLASLLALSVMVSLTTGYVIGKVAEGKRWQEFDGILWTVLAFASAFLVWPLNYVLPEEGFPFNLIAGAWLSWMIILCGFVSWRDQTLLFLNLPCLALFGLVGTFDTYKPATLMFFAFLVSSALLYARIHQRGMLERAKMAGVGDPAILRRDSWRWVAGPEWGLASAAAVVIISLVGAPILQLSLQEVSGTVRVQLPNPPTSQNRQTQTMATSEQFVGRGPVNPSNDPVFQVDLRQIGYLRRVNYAIYNGRGWSRVNMDFAGHENFGENLPSKRNKFVTERGGVVAFPNGVPFEPLDDARLKEIRYRPAGNVPLDVVVGPGPIREVLGYPRENLTFTYSGQAELRPNLMENKPITATYWDSTVDPAERKATLPKSFERIRESYFSSASIDERIQSFANDAVRKANANTDYEKARAVQLAISAAARYNLNAAAAPPNQDPVAFFLFESKEGYCDLFASAMVLGARSVGLPARYAIGYIVNDPSRDKDGFMTVRRRDAHAWAEIYFEGAGWVVFDPTEGALPVPGGERGSAIELKRPWLNVDLLGQGFGQFALVGFGTAILGLILFRGRESLGIMPPRQSALARAHSSFVRTIERRTGSPRKFSQTTTEYVEQYGFALDETLREARRLAKTFEDALYSPNGDTVAPEVAKEVAAFRTAVSRLPKG